MQKSVSLPLVSMMDTTTITITAITTTSITIATTTDIPKTRPAEPIQAQQQLLLLLQQKSRQFPSILGHLNRPLTSSSSSDDPFCAHDLHQQR